MTVHIYLMSYTLLTDANGNKNYGPKYLPRRFPNPDMLAGLEGLEGRNMRYGDELVGLVALDVTPAQHTILTGPADVTAIPLNLDNQLGANVATVQTNLETLKIPAENLQASFTFRQVVRAVAFIFEVVQILRGKGLGLLFGPGVTLATTLGALPQAVRDGLQEAAISKGVDYSGLTGASTLRQALRTVANNAVPFTFLGVEI
jgi:hypothetical protein